MKERFDILHYKISRIDYFHTADIEHVWNVAVFSDAVLSHRVFSYFPLGSSGITEGGKSHKRSKRSLCISL